jgi:hypothetical protein
MVFEEYFHLTDAGIATDDADPHPRRLWMGRAHVAFALAYPGLYPATYPTSGPLPGQVERSGALLRAGCAELEQVGALRLGITAALATNVLRAALRGVANTVTANPRSDHNDFTSVVVRDAQGARRRPLSDLTPDRVRTLTTEQ